MTIPVVDPTSTDDGAIAEISDRTEIDRFHVST
jgi:hypothetical protein